MSDFVIEADNLIKTFVDGENQIEVLKGVNLLVQEGQQVAIMGQSGSGKSTLMHLLGGLDMPTEGQVTLLGQRFSNLSDKARGRLRNDYLGFVYQFHHLLPEFSALENVMMPLLIARTDSTSDIKERASRLLSQVELGERMHHRPSELSGGERQRVAIARALVNEPACLLADEPTGNLDVDTAQTVIDLMKGINDELSTSMVIVTHDASLAEQMDVTYHMHLGQLS